MSHNQPLLVQEVVGVLQLINKVRGAFDEADEQMLGELQRMIGSSLFG